MGFVLSIKCLAFPVRCSPSSLHHFVRVCDEPSRGFYFGPALWNCRTRWQSDGLVWHDTFADSQTNVPTLVDTVLTFPTVYPKQIVTME